MDAPLLVGAVQMRTMSDKTANLERVEALVDEAVRRGARLVVLPEVFSWCGPRVEEAVQAEPVPGPTMERMATLARTQRVYLVAGSILERVEGEEKLYNTSTVFDPGGHMLGRYRKIHLFDVDIPGQVSIRESDTRLAGAEPVVIDTEVGKLGLAICYDLRFPELFRRLVRLGAEIVCLPSAFTFPTGAAHWEILVRARAVENQVHVIAANQSGRGPHGRDYGNSMIVDPWGIPVARAAEGEGVIVAEASAEHRERIRRELPALQSVRLHP